MQKIIIDTNVLVSALIQKSFPFLILDHVLTSDDFKICLSEELIREYVEVLNRPKFLQFPDFHFKAEQILVEIDAKSEFFVPKTKLNIIKDLDDNMILELAEESNADYIITGNTKDFTISYFKNSKILSPKDFWEMISEKF